MTKKEIIVPVYLKNGRAVSGPHDFTAYEGGNAAALAERYGNCGADAILLFDFSDGDAEHDAAIGVIKEMARTVDIPIYGGGNVRRLEDVKKLLYAGCQKVFLNYAKEANIELTHEASSRFGKEKLLACVKDAQALGEAASHGPLLCGIVLLAEELLPDALQMAARQDGDIPQLLVVQGWDGADGESATSQLPPEDSTQGASEKSPEVSTQGASEKSPEGSTRGVSGMMEDVLSSVSPKASEKLSFFSSAAALLRQEAVLGLCARAFMSPEYDYMALKHALKEADIPVNTYETSVAWPDLLENSDGLVPVVVQDYKTQEVLMVAYMNQEAYEMTVRTGRMTYWSRSRQELWVKGLTSGHFQYLKELLVDCDKDTLLAKVHQVGAACHTGNRSCFYRTILKKEYDETNPLKVFEDVYRVIEDRKIHPKEGSYTNYLFDKGIDKILKKVGEEATEIIIAAKNPDPEEIKYEISDFLYHVMVLMAERQVTWEDITKELARR